MRTTQEPLPLEIAAGEWHLDAHTKEIGRRGLADARAALAEAARRVEEREARRRAAGQHGAAAA
jgi:hypothetical protein